MSERRWKVSIVGHGEVDPRTIVLHPQNPKAHPREQHEVVGASLEELGWLKGVMINRVTGHLLDGEERVTLAIAQGERTVPVDYVEVPAEHEATVLRVLDQSAALARMDVERWRALAAGSPAPVSGVLRAFFAEQIRAEEKGRGARRNAAGEWEGTWRDGVKEMEGALAAAADAVRGEWGVAPGQLWACGEHRVICGDSLDAGVVQRVCGERRVALVVTSPPYSVGKGYEAGETVGTQRGLIEGLGRRCAAVVQPGGFVVVNFGDPWARETAGPWTGSARACVYPMGREYWRAWHEELGWDLYACRVWVKPYARLRQPLWTYHTSLAHQGEWEQVWTWRLPGGEGEQVYTWDVSAHSVWSSVGEVDSDGAGPWAHWGAGFPQWVPRQVLRAHSAPGQVVWEPFLGAGTTLLACEELGRTCVGSDRDPCAIALTLQRFRDATGVRPVQVG